MIPSPEPDASQVPSNEELHKMLEQGVIDAEEIHARLDIRYILNVKAALPWAAEILNTIESLDNPGFQSALTRFLVLSADFKHYEPQYEEPIRDVSTRLFYAMEYARLAVSDVRPRNFLSDEAQIEFRKELASACRHLARVLELVQDLPKEPEV